MPNIPTWPFHDDFCAVRECQTFWTVRPLPIKVSQTSITLPLNWKQGCLHPYMLLSFLCLLVSFALKHIQHCTNWLIRLQWVDKCVTDWIWDGLHIHYFYRDVTTVCIEILCKKTKNKWINKTLVSVPRSSCPPWLYPHFSFLHP